MTPHHITLWASRTSFAFIWSLAVTPTLQFMDCTLDVGIRRAGIDLPGVDHFLFIFLNHHIYFIQPQIYKYINANWHPSQADIFNTITINYSHIYICPNISIVVLAVNRNTSWIMITFKHKHVNTIHQNIYTLMFNISHLTSAELFTKKKCVGYDGQLLWSSSLSSRLS